MPEEMIEVSMPLSLYKKLFKENEDYLGKITEIISINGKLLKTRISE